MTFQKEADFEEALIKVLADKGWEKEVIKNPTEQDQMCIRDRLYTGEMQAFPYLFRPIEPVSRLLELYMLSLIHI